MKKTTLVIMSLILLLVLAACGQTGEKTNNGSNTTAASSETDAQADQSAADTAADASGEAAAPRIASISIHVTSHLLALGITPVGSVVGGGLQDFLPQTKEQLQSTKKLGTLAEPDMEAILALKPDVIYVDKGNSQDYIDDLMKIAPVEAFDLDEGTWRDTLRAIAKLVNKEQEAEQYISDYKAQEERVKALIDAEIGENSKVMAIRVTEKELRVFGMKRPMGPLLFEDLQLTPAAGVDQINKAYEAISQEVLPDYDADAIFVVVNSEEKAQQLFDQLEENPIWQGLKAVKNKHVYVVADQPWLDYSSLGAKMALDEAEAMFGK
ncbi:iron complex transport system substrate-binding protein [Paenibacillus phyllosphaerae]|uniref:Iron complex transport system substrate-binding protein n=1 Tax=Paenibacillus phyllosphaerae TaxID=274593 RepID=A0A7W5FNI7_9BACL|nr:ABC transporter substrate-binding protein [Paenibacillus phyllosphaerae]MBB3111355.1 iron complex transport system substrate-binding protein [Paenibacillus phyllosphaerae]